MKFTDIIRAFENETVLPIKPQRIADLIRQNTELSNIVFIGVNLNTDFLRGKFVRVKYSENFSPQIPPPYQTASGDLIAKIYYDQNQPADWIRLVINKELLHILDPDFVRTATAEEAGILGNRIRLPPELLLATEKEDTHISALIDYVTDFRAVVAMLPHPIRCLICEKYAQKKIDEQQISALTGIPIRYVSSILSDRWEVLRNLWFNGSN